jgi:6-phosphogluconate dehydrogenase (decarboxylating)
MRFYHRNECDEENKGVNKDKTVIFAQDITDNTQSDNVDKIIDLQNFYKKLKKPQAEWVMIFYGE